MVVDQKSISILLPDLRGGGAEKVMIDLAEEFQQLGFSVEFVVMQGVGDFFSYTQLKFKVFTLNVHHTRWVPFALARYLRSRRPDALIANMWPLSSAAVLGRILSRSACRLLLVEHNTLTRQYASWGRAHALMLYLSVAATYRFADKVAAVSGGAAKDTAHVAGLPEDRIEVLYNPIPKRPMPNKREKAMADALWACPPGFRILSVGSLKDQKNHALLLRSFARLHHPQACLLLLGQGENEAALRSLAIELGIAHRVVFAGFHANPAPFYATADLFVLSSDYEGFGNVIVEALFFGLPVVSTDCSSGPAEILESGRFGHLVPVGDAGALALAMEAAFEAPVDRDALVRRAEDFSPGIAVRKYLDVLSLT